MVVAGIRRNVYCILAFCSLVYWCFNNCYSTCWQDDNDILLNDDDDELAKRSGLRKRVAGTMMAAEAGLKKKGMVRIQ